MTAVPDNPIKDVSQDSLARSSLALSFARQVRALDSSEGLVVGILGQWGTGKTSFLNLMRPHFEAIGVAVIDFNPWMFSGSEQLAEYYFRELSAQLKMKPGFADLAKTVEEYGDAMSGIASLPVVGPWYSIVLGIIRAARRMNANRGTGVLPLQEKVRNALKAREHPIVIIIDDVDRLSTAEIKDVFKLVRLTASFPNLIYVLSFDRVRVERALAEDGIAGREYLEKILQTAIDLPFVPAAKLQSLIFAAIEESLRGIEVEAEFDEKDWPKVFFEIVRPLIRNVRDVKRYTSSLKWVVESMGGHVALVDILGLEAVRVFLPDLFLSMRQKQDTLTGVAATKQSEDGKALDEFLATAQERRAIAESLVNLLFPAAAKYTGGSNYGSEWQATWLKKKKVANPRILQFYMERLAGEALVASRRAEKAFAILHDAEALAAFFSDVPPEERETLIQSLEIFESDFTPEHVVTAVPVLLNLIPLIPDRRRGFFELDTEMVVGRVVYRLIRILPAEQDVRQAVERILPNVVHLSQKLQLLTIVGYRENAGHKLVSEADARELEEQWRNLLHEADVDSLAEESDLLRVFYEELHQVGENSDRRQVPDDPRVTLAMLRSARSETKTQSGDSPHVEYHPRLAWETLIKVYGDEELLKDRVIKLLEDEKGDVELLGLARKYLDGWRPEED